MSERVVHTPPKAKAKRRRADGLNGRRILVVGGGQMDIGEDDTPIGNGRAMSVLFAREGAKVAVADRDTKSADATVAHDRRPQNAFAIAADATKEDDIARMVEEAVAAISAASTGLCSMSASARAAPWLEGTTAEIWDNVFAMNLRSHMLTVKRALPKLRDGSTHRVHLLRRGHDSGQPPARL